MNDADILIRCRQAALDARLSTWADALAIFAIVKEKLAEHQLREHG